MPRRYTRREKAAAVGAAEVVGTLPAARAAGIPESTLRYWREAPAFAELRAQKREDVAADLWAGVQIGVRRTAELLLLTEDVAKAAVATGILYDKFALISGSATSRTETRALTDGMDDHERAALRAVLDGVLEQVPG